MHKSLRLLFSKPAVAEILRPIILVLVLTGILSIPLIVIGVLYHDRLHFAPDRLINDWVEFLFAILGTTVGFLISDVYWQRRLEREQIASFIDQYLDYINRAAQITVEASSALDEKHDDAEANHRRDSGVMTNLRRLGDTNTWIMAWQERAKVEWHDAKVRQSTAYYQQHIYPLMDGLSRRERLRPRVEEVEQTLANVGDRLEVLRKYLTEEEHEIHPPR